MSEYKQLSLREAAEFDGRAKYGANYVKPDRKKGKKNDASRETIATISAPVQLGGRRK